MVVGRWLAGDATTVGTLMVVRAIRTLIGSIKGRVKVGESSITI
jgi:hypothetical protein